MVVHAEVARRVVTALSMLPPCSQMADPTLHVRMLQHIHRNGEFKRRLSLSSPRFVKRVFILNDTNRANSRLVYAMIGSMPPPPQTPYNYVGTVSRSSS